MESSINSIKLIYPPISNRFADNLWEANQAVKDHLKKSHLYMLAQRSQLYFTDYSCDEKLRFNFSLVCGNIIYENLSVDLSKFIIEDNMILSVCEDNILRIYSDSIDLSLEEPTYWATTDKLLWDHSKELIKIEGDFDQKAISRFHLYYVGISKTNDSFTRLFKTGHKKRAKILSNEKQFNNNSVLSDELMIFFFEAEECRIKKFELTDVDFSAPLLNDKIDIISDAEKAFIKILDCKYNQEKYKNYPKCTDGLYNKGLQTYSFYINSDVSFITAKETIRGSSDIFCKKDYDFIMISGGNVTLIKGE